MEIIDTHCMYGINKPFTINYDIEHFKKIKSENPDYNLRFLVVSVSPETNLTIASTVNQNKKIFAGAYLQVIPRQDLVMRKTPVKELEKLCENPEIKGFKLVTSLTKTSINSKFLDPYIKLAEEYQKPFLFHCSATGEDFTSYEKNKEMIEKHPNLQVILAHWGGLNPEFIDGSKSLARDFQNVYLNMTGMSGEIQRYDLIDGNIKINSLGCLPDLRELWGQEIQSAMEDPILREKILFGTDSPQLKFDLYPLSLLSQKHMFQITVNAKKLFKLE